MKNPLKPLKALKQIKSIFKPLRGHPTRDLDDAAMADISELRVIWPNGRWKLADSPGSGPVMDNVIRGVLASVWAREDFLKAQADAVHELNPGMYSTAYLDIPKGWRPSEVAFKALFKRNQWDVRIMHYVIGELEAMGHLRP